MSGSIHNIVAPGNLGADDAVEGQEVPEEAGQEVQSKRRGGAGRPVRHLFGVVQRERREENIAAQLQQEARVSSEMHD